MLDFECTFSASVWCYVSTATWYFVRLPVDEAATIKSLQGTRAGFGSVPVTVRIGGSTWKTSIFPSKETSSYILPLKAAIRKAEGISKDSEVTVTLSVQSSF